jgi:SAM-dependent methyltransferase
MARRVLSSSPPVGTKLSRAVGAVRDRWRVPDAASGADQWQRVVLNRSVGRYLESLGPQLRTAVEISGDAHGSRPWKRYMSLNYPEFDLCATLNGRGSFDVVLCEQVIEHVVDPCAAASNLRGLCNPGGHVIVSTPFLIRVHELPEWGLSDYWRFTPRGLQTLLERAGLRVESVHWWGNRRCLAANLDRWPAYRQWHSLRGNAALPLQVWAFARNPS